MSKKNFLVMADAPPPEGVYSVVKDVESSVCTARNFKKAYEMACFLGKIAEPNYTYRQALTRFNDAGYVYIGEKGKPEKEEISLITTVNHY